MTIKKLLSWHHFIFYSMQFKVSNIYLHKKLWLKPLTIIGTHFYCEPFYAILLKTVNTNRTSDTNRIILWFLGGPVYRISFTIVWMRVCRIDIFYSCKSYTISCKIYTKIWTKMWITRIVNFISLCRKPDNYSWNQKSHLPIKLL